uniref:Synaptic plasticity regulator PANTS n=1 Tax=Megaselia scalaris TaxID=36166 RepID=T1H6Q7_MEGSC
IRPCLIYKDEYSECTSIKGRFHQYFIHGENQDCSQWKKDFDNCIAYNESDQRNNQAAEEIIRSEENRRQIRLKAHFANDTWSKRKSPPEDWAAPLPEWIVKKNENTY